MVERYDVVVVGSGPNGLAAAIALANEGQSVLVLEARDQVGGGARTADLTLPGFHHDVCSAIHPMALVSPFFRTLPLDRFGLSWADSPSALAHPLDDGTAALLSRSVDETAATLGIDDHAYRRAMAPLVADAELLFPDLLAPLRPPRNPFALGRFGLSAIRSADGLARSWFRAPHARALFGGCAAHSFLPLDAPLSAAIGIVLLLVGHAAGWPSARGGSQAISNALAAYLRHLGGTIETGRRVDSWSDLPPARAVVFDTSPRALVRIAGQRLPRSYVERLARYRYGPGVFKLDWALDGPIPWKAEACSRAGTVHLGGTFEEIMASEASVSRGDHPEKPYVLVAQQSLFDDSRAPMGQHTGWAYCHVPQGSTVDMTATIERQMERFAPGFRDRVLSRHAMSTADFETYNANYIGGDITGGANDWTQIFTRPVVRAVPYSTPTRGIYLCSSSTPPGGGVHGMCGYFAAKAVLRDLSTRT